MTVKARTKQCETPVCQHYIPDENRLCDGCLEGILGLEAQYDSGDPYGYVELVNLDSVLKIFRARGIEESITRGEIVSLVPIGQAKKKTPIFVFTPLSGEFLQSPDEFLVRWQKFFVGAFFRQDAQIFVEVLDPNTLEETNKYVAGSDIKYI